MKMGEKLEKVVDIIGEILAFLTVALMVFVFVNRYFGFLPADTAKIIESVLVVAVLLVVALAGLEFALKRGLIVFILYAALVAAAVIFLFFPGVLPATAKSASDALLPALLG